MWGDPCSRFQIKLGWDTAWRKRDAGRGGGHPQQPDAKQCFCVARWAGKGQAPPSCDPEQRYMYITHKIRSTQNRGSVSLEGEARRPCKTKPKCCVANKALDPNVERTGALIIDAGFRHLPYATSWDTDNSLRQSIAYHREFGKGLDPN